MKSILSAVVLAAVIAWPAKSFALDDATKTAIKACQREDTPPKAGVDACTKVLNGAHLTASKRTAFYYYRANFYESDSAYDKAKADFTAAINAYNTDPTKANWGIDFVGLVASSYAHRAEINATQLKNCDAAKADYRSAAHTAREISERDGYEKLARTACK